MDRGLPLNLVDESARYQASLKRGTRYCGEASRTFPRETAIGSLCHYVSHADAHHYQPANIAFDLFPPLDPNPRDRKERQTAVCKLAIEKLDEFVAIHV